MPLTWLRQERDSPRRPYFLVFQPWLVPEAAERETGLIQSIRNHVIHTPADYSHIAVFGLQVSPSVSRSWTRNCMLRGTTAIFHRCRTRTHSPTNHDASIFGRNLNDIHAKESVKQAVNIAAMTNTASFDNMLLIF